MLPAIIVSLTFAVNSFHSSFAAGPAVSVERSVQDVGNPMVDVDKCGRKGLKSNICDPDNIITASDG